MPEDGRAAFVAEKIGPSSREELLKAELTELTRALSEAAVKIPVWKRRDGSLEPFENLQAIRAGVGMPTSRFCSINGVPART